MTRTRAHAGRVFPAKRRRQRGTGKSGSEQAIVYGIVLIWLILLIAIANLFEKGG